MTAHYDFTPEQREKLDILTGFMLEYNKNVNLTRITEPGAVWEKHFLDSVFPVAELNVPRGTSVIDIGTGAGFPGAVLAVVRPDLDLTLLDSLKKRVLYLELLREKLGVGYRAVHGRGEELAHDTTYRERYDLAVSRAVAGLAALCEYCLPYVKVGGCFVAYKGGVDETGSAQNAIKLLGGEVENVRSYTLPGGDQRQYIVIRKISQTPPKFPRKAVNIAKNPL